MGKKQRTAESRIFRLRRTEWRTVGSLAQRRRLRRVPLNILYKIERIPPSTFIRLFLEDLSAFGGFGIRHWEALNLCMPCEA